jgi:hypothetical protein
MILVGVVAAFTYLITIGLGIRTYQHLKSLQNLMSERTIRLQSNMTRVLVIKAIFPFCLSTVPVFGTFLNFVFKTNIEHMGFYSIMMTNLIPLVSPLSTLLLLTGYRRRFLAMVLRPFGPKNRVGLFVTNSRSDNSTVPRGNTINVLSGNSSQQP